jgi:hypothetical protein
MLDGSPLGEANLMSLGANLGPPARGAPHPESPMRSTPPSMTSPPTVT